MIVSLICIYKIDFFEIKVEIYYQIIGVIIKSKLKSHILDKIIWINITGLEKAAIKNLLIM